MASTDAIPIPIKNTAYRVTFPILDADGDLVTGASALDSEVSKDAGTFTDCTNEATEIATASGMYYLDLTSTEMNADCVAIIVKTSTSGAKTVPIVLYPQETGDIKVDVTSFGGTAGTFSAGRPEANTTHIAGSAVNTTSPQLGVRLVNIGASAVDTTSAQLGVRLVNIGASAVDTTSAQIGVRLNNINGSAVDTTTAQLGVRIVNIGANALNTASAQIGVNIVNILGVAVDTTSAQLGVRLNNINGSAVDSTSAQLGVRVNAIASTPVNSVADGLLDRDMSLGTDTGSTTVRTVRQAVRPVRNKVSFSGGTMTVYKEDDTTTSWTAAVTTDSTASPITAIDPAG